MRETKSETETIYLLQRFRKTPRFSLDFFKKLILWQFFGRNGCVNLQNIILNLNSLIHSTFKCFSVPEIAQSIGDIVPVLKPSLIPQLLSIYYEPDALGIQEQTGDTGSLSTCSLHCGRREMPQGWDIHLTKQGY